MAQNLGAPIIVRDIMAKNPASLRRNDTLDVADVMNLGACWVVLKDKGEIDENKSGFVDRP
jgi:hypothetical protein